MSNKLILYTKSSDALSIDVVTQEDDLLYNHCGYNQIESLQGGEGADYLEIEIDLETGKVVNFDKIKAELTAKMKES